MPRLRNWAAAGCCRSAKRREPTSMTADQPTPEPAGKQPAGKGSAGKNRSRGGRGWIPGRSRKAEASQRMRILSVGGRSLRVSVREGTPGWPPLLLCNGIGVSLELLQPFVDALDPRRPVIRFDMPGVGGSPAAVKPYHLVTLPSLLARLLDELSYQQAGVPGI